MTDKLSPSQASSGAVPNDAAGVTIDEALTLAEEYFPSYRLGVEVSLSAIATLLLADNANPTFLIKEGPSGAGKTTIDQITGKIPDISLWVDVFTTAAFQSHRADRKKEQLEETDLLPKMRRKVLITSDLAPTLGQKEENLRSAISIVTRVLDGQGFSSWSGSQGNRTYEGDYLFVWLASTTPLSRSAWFEIGRAGTRALFFNQPSEEGSVDLSTLVTGEMTYSDKKEMCHEAVMQYLKGLWGRTGGPRGVKWPKERPDDPLLGSLGQLTQLMVDWRAMVSDEQVMKDSPNRHFMLLYNLARGHALLYERTELDSDDVAIAARVASDSVPHWRRPMLGALIRKGELTTTDVVRVCKVSRPTAVKYMEELETIGAVELDKPGGSFDKEQSQWRISLLPAHRWVLDPDNGWLWYYLPC